MRYSGALSPKIPVEIRSSLRPAIKRNRVTQISAVMIRSIGPGRKRTKGEPKVITPFGSRSSMSSCTANRATVATWLWQIRKGPS